MGRQKAPQAGSPQHERGNQYFLHFASDADRELRIPIDEAATYQTLQEGVPGYLARCKVMIKTFDRVNWFLVVTRHRGDGPRNSSIHETMGFSWNGPLTVMRLEGPNRKNPIGILTAEHHQAAIAAVERYLDVMSEELGRPDGGQWRTYILDYDVVDVGLGELY